METEQIVSTATERLASEGQTSLSQRTISDYFAQNLPSEGTEPDAAYWDKHIPILKSLSLNFSHDVAEAKRLLSEEHNNANKQQIEPDKQNNVSTQSNKEIEELRKSLDALTKKIEEQATTQSRERILEAVKAEMIKKGATDEYVLKQTLRYAKIDTTQSVSAITDKLIQAYDEEYTACRGTGAAPRSGQGGNANGGQTAVSKFFANKKAKEGWGNPTAK